MAQQSRAVKPPDEMMKYVPACREHLQLEDAQNVRYWVGRFGVTTEQLHAATEVWGYQIADLRLLLDLQEVEPEDPPMRTMAPWEADDWAFLFVELYRRGSLPTGVAREFLLSAADWLRGTGSKRSFPR